MRWSRQKPPILFNTRKLKFCNDFTDESVQIKEKSYIECTTLCYWITHATITTKSKPTLDNFLIWSEFQQSFKSKKSVFEQRGR